VKKSRSYSRSDRTVFDVVAVLPGGWECLPIAYDNYNSAWGDQSHLDRFLQIYAVEKARIEARKKGHQITEQSLADGS
jgi:hypothetical protein